ncbi:biotin-dependent carboxyltransferase family protein [Granulicoccus sp. GXG6511]|uniref:5-oxoprolinase subunit C family protein n=1 Tax=Granulicoccus sp. GXG6511 TaxID=3381351 RepID=UPI003D7EE318
MTGDPADRAAFEVLDTGALTLLCDLGRPGFAALGVSGSGAADRAAYRLGQRLVGQNYQHAALEVTFGGLALRCRTRAWVALTGADARATLAGRAVGHGAAFEVQADQELVLGVPERGLRTYVSVRGGFAVPPVLRSRSSDVLSGLGPDPLKPGQLLAIGPASAGWEFEPVEFAPTAWPLGPGPIELAIVPGPRDDWFVGGLARLVGSGWVVSAESNRVGVRLSGPVLERRSGLGELVSEPMVRGSVQVPPNGRPVVFGADHPVTGGYPVIGVLTPTASDRIAQARPGDEIRFVTRG